MYTYVATAILSMALAATGAWQVQNWRYGSKETERLKLVAEQLRQSEKQADSASVGHEVDKSKIKVQFRTITREVTHVIEKPLYSTTCFDSAGLRLVASAVSGQSTPSELTATLPGLGQP